MKIGIIAQGRNCADVLDDVLAPWIRAMEKLDIHICLITATFKEMEKLGGSPKNDDNTWEKFEEYAQQYPKNISTSKFDKFVSEAESRDLGRQILMSDGIKVDLIWLLDLSDEYYTLEQIEKIVAFVKSEPFTTWFKICFRNYVFDRKTYLVEPFIPPRIWRVESGGYKLSKCVYDNDFLYTNVIGAQVLDKSLSNYIIPKSVALVKHFSWLSDERGKQKCAYQNLHFGFSNGCSYRWNDKKNRLEFNDEFFKKINGTIPRVERELD